VSDGRQIRREADHRFAEHCQCEQPEREHADRLLSELLGRLRAFGGKQAGELGNEGCVERALSEQPPEQVRELVRDEEGIGNRPGSDEGRDQDVAQEAKQAARHRPAADS
jgi:hypothetical protein